MFTDPVTELRHIAAAHTVPEAPLGKMLLTLARAIEADRAGLAALAERIGVLEDAQADALAAPEYEPPRVHVLGRANQIVAAPALVGPQSATDDTGFSDGDR